MKIISKIIMIVSILILIFSNNFIYASMADYTDEQADKELKQEQEDWQKEQEERINQLSNNYLKSLSIDKYSITSNFDKQIRDYEIEQEINDDYLQIKAESDDKKASVSGIGKVALNSGENNLKIDVIAENGTVRSYFIKVRKVVKKDLRLKDLKLKIDEKNYIDITPEFNENIYEYNCKIQNDIQKIDVDATTNYDNADIEIIGNENLQEGLNEIIISISLEGEKNTYKINVYKDKLEQIQEEKKESNTKNKNIIIVAIVIISIICVISIILSIKKIKNTKSKGKH